MRYLFLLLLFSPLFGEEELFMAPPRIWKTDCYPCRPLETPLREIEPNIIVDLRNPCYEGGVLSTNEGGILTAPFFRVQADELIYTRNLEADNPVFTVQCTGNILIDYRQWVLVGDYLYYDFLTHTGFLINGKTAQPPWYVGGREVLLLNSGDIEVLDSYLTTSEGERHDVVIRSPSITLTPDKVVTARHINLWVKKLPLFWFPKLKLDLDTRGHSPFGFAYGWAGFMGSYVSFNYRFLSWGDLKGLARLDAFFGHGPGFGIETRYNPKLKPTECYTRSYYAHDISIDDRKKRDRYRLQGTFYDCIRGVSVNGMYDYVSDPQMAADFQIQDFNIPTAGRTQLELRKRENAWIANLFTRIRINDFQSVNQELPSFAFHLHPFEIPYTGVLVENTFEASYLNYVFSEDVTDEKSFHSGRIATTPRLYRPFSLGPITTTPEIGFIGIGYSNSQSGHSAGQAIGLAGLRCTTSLSACTPYFKHVIEPYAHYQSLSRPRVSKNNHYLFTIDDGYYQLSLLRLGIVNSFFVKAPCGISRPVWIDLWTNAFLDQKHIPQTFQKGYLNIEWEPYGRIFANLEVCWNFQHNQCDYINNRIEWTVSDDFALGIEYRQRGPYDWRKANFYNFILDVAQPQEALLASPLSFHRNTFLFRAFYRLTPTWTIKWDLRRGWNLRKQPNYLEYQLELSTLLFEHWRLQFIYEKREPDHRFSLSLKLNPGPPPKRKACL